jgi:fructosamine-3-kinase
MLSSPILTTIGSYLGDSAGDDVAAWIADGFLEFGKTTNRTFMGGSDWSSGYVYENSSGQKLFVKIAQGRSIEMFRGEAEGLKAMHGE